MATSSSDLLVRLSCPRAPPGAPQSCFTEMAVLEHMVLVVGSSLTGEVLPGAQWHTDALKAKLARPPSHSCLLSLGQLEKEV